jgi:ABC-type branched-subunit amino acid transport system substrate-binding protein
MSSPKRFALAAAAVLALGSIFQPAMAAPSGPPIRIGSTLALTGPLAATGLVHKIAGEIYVEELNRKNGFLGRPVQWVLKDDQSKPDLARTLYEQLVTVEKVDLLMGPYATGAILSAMSVAQRYNKVLLHHTFGTPSLAKYDMQFPVSGGSGDPEITWPNLVFTAVQASAKPPKTVAIITSKFPSVHFISVGARDVAKKRGLREVAYLEWDFGNRDFGPIAARIKDAKPDFIWVGALGLEGNLLLDAMKKIDYAPPMHFYTFPAPGPMAKSPDAKNALALSTFEEHAPFTSNPVAAQLTKLYHERAQQAGLPDNSVELQASVSFTAWQVLDAAVHGAKSLDDKSLAAWLKKNQVDTIIGKLRWEGPNNYVMGNDLYKVKQLQDGKWLVVWPKEFAAPGARMLTP